MKKGIKDGFKIFGLSNWEGRVACSEMEESAGRAAGLGSTVPYGYRCF